GRHSDGLTQSATLVFRMGGIDLEKVASDEEICQTWITVSHNFPINHCVLMWPVTPNGTVRVNMVHVLRFDGTKNTELTRARFEGTRQAEEITQFFRDHVRGFAGAYVDQTAEQIGVRETRRIVGDYVLTQEDVLEGRSFDDQVALCCWPIDIHNPDGIHTGVGQWPAGPYGIPYRCITPQGVENLYVVGRPISSTHEANSSSRLNSACTAIGQAAGCAARMAIEAGSVRKIDVGALLKKLSGQGAILSKDEL
ncbi:MAG: FAD-dependent oxidoreductase, partial [Lentisphaerae bacterium]|nr:FAD-dependent oxidoreductase [Lentisphaerota bacterium]